MRTKRDAGFVQGHDIMATFAFGGSVALALWLRGGAMVVGAGVLFGIVLFFVARYAAGVRVHVELGCLVTIVEVAILFGAGYALQRAAFEPLVSLSIACGSLAAVYVLIAVALRIFDR